MEDNQDTTKTAGFWTRLFVVDERTGQPEFSKILGFLAILLLFIFQGYSLFVMRQPFNAPEFAQAVAWTFGGTAAYLGVSEFFRQRFQRGPDLPPMMDPPPPPDAPDDNTPPQAS